MTIELRESEVTALIRKGFLRRIRATTIEP